MAPPSRNRSAAKPARRTQKPPSRPAKPGSLAAAVQHFAAKPLYRCLVQPEMFETGMGTVILARQAETGEIAMAAFLVDAFALGVKDVLFQVMDRAEFDLSVTMMGQAAPFEAVAPSYARKLLDAASAYAASLGLPAPRGSVTLMRLFADARAEDCPAEFSFGHGGKPYYVVGASESPAQVARRLGRLTDRLGPDGFDFMVPIDDETCLTSADAEPLLFPMPGSAANDS